uniref:hypothetical protein n=1 Tax=Lentilactobacillus hilgardii TaxID=1588 RepID=UPI00403F3D59
MTVNRELIKSLVITFIGFLFFGIMTIAVSFQSTSANVTTQNFRYYQHRNKVKVTKNTYAYRMKITYPLATAKADASVLLKKGTILKVVYPGTTWSWEIVGSHRFPETSKHVWVINRNSNNWFKVLHHYKSMKL